MLENCTYTYTQYLPYAKESTRKEERSQLGG